MTYADILARLAADAGNVSMEEGRFIIARFRAELKNQLPEPECLDVEIPDDQAEATISRSRQNSLIADLIGSALAAYGQSLIPRA